MCCPVSEPVSSNCSGTRTRLELGSSLCHLNELLGPAWGWNVDRRPARFSAAWIIWWMSLGARFASSNVPNHWPTMQRSRTRSALFYSGPQHSQTWPPLCTEFICHAEAKRWHFCIKASSAVSQLFIRNSFTSQKRFKIKLLQSESDARFANFW